MELETEAWRASISRTQNRTGGQSRGPRVRSAYFLLSGFLVIMMGIPGIKGCEGRKGSVVRGGRVRGDKERREGRWVRE